MNGAFIAGLVAVFLATVSWGVQLPLAHDAFDVVDPFHMTAVRFGAAALLLVPLLIAREGLAAMSYRGAGGTAAALGLVGMCGSPTLVFMGMQMSSAEHAVVIVALQPAMTALLRWWHSGQRPAGFVLGCIGLAFCGVLLVVTRGSIDFLQSPTQLAGDAIIALGALCWVVYTMGLTRLPRWSVFRITVLTMIPGAAGTALLTTVMTGAGKLTPPGSAELLTVGWELAYLTLVGVLLAMLAWNFGTRRIGALNAILFINCMPVTTFVYRALQGYSIAAVEVVGATCVVAALVANNLHARRVML